MIHKYPTNFARFYDTIYQHVRNSIDKEFFLRHITESQGKVLEIGVGTGRLFTDALKKGADIYGIDISENMLDVLKNKLDSNQQYRISNQSITNFHFDFHFNLIIAPFRVIMHVLDKKEQIQSINNIFYHLEHGGTFIFDAFVPDLGQLLNGLDNVTDFEGEYKPGKKLKRMVSTKPDLINQLIHIHFRLEWDEEDQIMYEDWKLPFRFFFRYELEHLIERSKFKQHSILGDYQGNPLNGTSKEFIMVCKKE